MSNTSKTAVIQFSEAEIKRQADGNALTLRDPRYPGLRFRFTGDRTTGSWYLLAGRSWKKVAGYPQLPVRKILEILPELHAKHALGQSVTAGGQFATVGDLLRWYGERFATDRHLSEKRRQGVKSMLEVQLLPRIGQLRLTEVAKDTLDAQLMWPMLSELSLSYVHSCLRLLKMAFSRAHRLGMIDSNPMDGLQLADFTRSKIKPKPARLSMLDLPGIVQQIADGFNTAPVESMLALMMLAHGSRIGETRIARWSHICLNTRAWVIPAENTKTKTELRLPLTDRMCELLALYRERMGKRATPAGGLFVQQVSSRVITASQAQASFRRLSGGNWTSHDLRKLARTGWVELGVDYLIGEKLLNHNLSLMAETYINTTADQLKIDALTQWHQKLDEAGLHALATDTNDAPSVIRKTSKQADSKAASENGI